MSSLVLRTNLTKDGGFPELGKALYHNIMATDPKTYNSDRSVPTLRVPFNEDGNIEDGPNLLAWEHNAPFADGKASPESGRQWYIDREVKEGNNVRYFNVKNATYSENKTTEDIKAMMAVIVKYDCFAGDKEANAQAAAEIVQAVYDKYVAKEITATGEVAKAMVRIGKGENISNKQIKAVGKVFANMVN